MKLPDERYLLTFESGSRIHLTEFDWPKHNTPSGFCMKLRKHIRNARLESLNQMGSDRVIDLYFTTGTDNYHLIVELYDRGNVILTDGKYCILSLLRTRKDGDETRFAVRELYPVDKVQPPEVPITLDRIKTFLGGLKNGDDIKKSLNHNLNFGGYLIEHCLLKKGFKVNCKFGKGFNPETDTEILFEALQEGDSLIRDADTAKGYVFKKKKTYDPAAEKLLGEKQEDLEILDTFQPFLFIQYEDALFDTFDTFNRAVDTFFSNLEESKISTKTFGQEKAAFKKLTNIQKDHEKRIGELERLQGMDIEKATLIEENLDIVEKAIALVNEALTKSMAWKAIEEMVREAPDDPVASKIRRLDLYKNHLFLFLQHPEEEDSDLSADSTSSEEELGATPNPKPVKSQPAKQTGFEVDIDITISAYSNIRRYYTHKKAASTKQQKTTAASSKAIKSAEKKTKTALKEVQTIAQIKKVRKTYWFEKFFWFISSDNYLIIGGRDRQQNDIIVKKHLMAGDVYVHADVHGSSSVVVKNPSGSPIPPRTLHEAGTFVICHSAAWDEKMITSAYWVNPDQVSKTTPSGQYIQTGSFMIRGKKNYLPHSYLVFGIGILFKVDDSCVDNHLHERQPKLGEIADIVPETPTEEKDFPLDLFEDRLFSSDEDEKIDNAEPAEPAEPVKDEVIDEYDFPDTMISIPTAINSTKVKNKSVHFENTNSIPIKPARKEGPNKSIPTPENENDPNQEILTKGQPQMTRAQRRKLKKSKKYADQDEDDRDEAMEKLMSAGITKFKGKKKKKGATSKRQAHFQDNLQHTKSPELSPHESGSDGAERGSDEEAVGSDAAEKGSGNADRENNASDDIAPVASEEPSVSCVPKSKEVPPVDNLLKQMNVLNRDEFAHPKESELTEQPDDVEGSSDAADINIFSYLNTLTSQPLEDDIILYAVVTCAPYNTLTDYKYKAKLSPGSGKKGKALQVAFHAFANSSDVTQLEKDHIKSLKDTDVSYLMPGKKVALSIAGSVKH